MPIDKSQFGKLAAFYRQHLSDQIMGFWDRFSPDGQNGGYFHCLGETGQITDRRKNMWCQGRMTYMYSTLYRRLEKKPQWLANAKLGRDFMVRHGYKGNGRWHYMLDEKGTPVNSNPSYFADAFVLQGLCEYALATGDMTDLPLIRATFDALENNIHDTRKPEFWHFTPEAGVRYQGPSMIQVGMAPSLRPILGEERVKPMVDHAIHNLLHVFYKGNGLFYEVLSPDGQPLPDNKSFVTNPGHTIEGSWFCMEEAIRRNDRAMLDRAVELAAAAYDKGHDPKLGGMFGFVDIHGKQPPGPEVMNPWGERWDHKIWWVHSEGLNALILGAIATERQDMLDRFMAMHEFTFKYFPDPVHGEWYEYLERDGKPWYKDKAKWIKSAYHIPRNLLNIVQLLEANR